MSTWLSPAKSNGAEGTMLGAVANPDQVLFCDAAAAGAAGLGAVSPGTH